MIVVKLMGGLGNQMFQYAFGRYLALQHKTTLKLDLSYLQDRTPKKDFTYRNYELDVFNLRCEMASQEEVSAIFYPSNNKFLKLFHRFNYGKVRHIRERSFAFQKELMFQNGNLYVEGYWQSEKYFKSIEAILRDDFSLKGSLSFPAEKLKQRIKENNSVSLHLRRGDFVNNACINQYHGVCSLDYYQKAILYIHNHINNPTFFIFSDDIDWVKSNLAPDAPHVFVQSDPLKKNHEDMYLMSLCNAHIIANSSFSWWGAWLNPDKNKKVIAPKKWFNDPSVDISDLIPENWIKIE